MTRRRREGTSWRYTVDGDTLTASNKVMSYTLRIGVMYQPAEHARTMSKGPIGPRSVTQFLDGGERLYTVGTERATNGRDSARTVATVASFVGTYQVPRVLVAPRKPKPAALAAPLDTERMSRLEARVEEVCAMVRAIADGLGVCK